MQNKVKILFVFHEAHLTGATLVLFNSVKWYSENTDMEMTFLLKEDGILRDEISKIGSVYLWKQDSFVKGNIFQRVFRKMFCVKTPQQILLKNLKKERFDMIYANTVVCAGIIKKMADFDAKIVWHIHELELAVKSVGNYVRESFKYADIFIANSKATKKNLVDNGVDSGKILVSYPFISRKKIEDVRLSPSSLRKDLNIPEDAFIIGSSGSGTLRKGIQSFIQLPLIMDDLMPGNKFFYVWVGKIFDKEVVEYDIKNTKMSEKIVLVGEQLNPFPYYNIFDVFVSCSKQESFGLSAIESAALKKPLFCFKDTGGIQELVDEANNISVPYLDHIRMAKEIISVHNDYSRRQQLGESAYSSSKEYDVNLIMPLMYGYLKNIKEGKL